LAARVDSEFLNNIHGAVDETHNLFGSRRVYKARLRSVVTTSQVSLAVTE